MIWYFTGSGNSQHVAEKLATAAGCEAAPIEAASVEAASTQAASTQAASTQAASTQTAGAQPQVWGIVFPVYCCGLPEIVVRFLRNVVNVPAPVAEPTAKPYVFLAATCGVSSGMALQQAAELLTEHGVSVNASFSFVMADNDACMYDIDPVAAATANLAAEKAVDAAAALIAQRASVPNPEDFTQKAAGSGATGSDAIDTFAANTFAADAFAAAKERYKFYDEKRRCAHLSASAACIGCGLCSDNCPDQVISLVDGAPAWTAERCQMCLRCLHHCPTAAIAYDSVFRGQYTYAN